MVRTQIYLTETQHNELVAIAEAEGKKQSELIRRAVDDLIERLHGRRQVEILQKTAGMWKDRNDLPDFDSLRAEWNRT
jgi:hypothetical protein